MGSPFCGMPNGFMQIPQNWEIPTTRRLRVPVEVA